MKKKCWKKIAAGMLTMGMMLILLSIPAFADINGDEQNVIDFYNQTFYYNGKSYVASDAAKSAAYAKLDEAGTDLTGAQVDSMILQAKNNIANGISEGYLIEVTQEESPNPDEEESQQTEVTESTEDTQETEQTERMEDSEDTQETEQTERMEDSEDTQETEQQPNGDRENDSENKSEQKNPVEIEKEKIDLGSIIEEGTENVEIYRQDGNRVNNIGELADGLNGHETFTVVQYKSGISTVVSDDGTVIYKKTLPVKNTGYTTMPDSRAIIVIVVGMIIVILVTTKIGKKKYGFLLTAILIAAVMIAAAFIGGKKIADRATAEWRTVWIAGAPEYEYVQKKQEQTQAGQEIIQPILGTQYGQISCEEIGLESPLYYGDSDELLETGAGTYKEGYLPGEQGTVLIGGHDSTYFAQLAEMETGNQIKIDTVYGTWKYEVTEIKIADASDLSAYPIESGNEELILYTCYPFGETSQLRSQRYFVYAKRVAEVESGE